MKKSDPSDFKRRISNFDIRISCQSFNPLLIASTNPPCGKSPVSSQNIIPPNFLLRTNFAFSAMERLSSKVANNFFEALYWYGAAALSSQKYLNPELSAK